MEITGRILNWTLHPNSYGVYATGFIQGDAKGRWRDGQSFHTSQILSFEEYACCFLVKTLNSLYCLPKGCGTDEDATSLQTLVTGCLVAKIRFNLE